MERHQHLRPDTELLGDLALHVTLMTLAGRHGAAGTEHSAHHFGGGRGHGDIASLGKCARELRPRVFHDRPPRRSVGIAGIDQPRPIAGKNLEHCVEHVAQHLLDLVGSLHGAVHPVHRFEKPDVRPVLRFCALLDCDVDDGADELEEPAGAIEYRMRHRAEMLDPPVGQQGPVLELEPRALAYRPREAL